MIEIVPYQASWKAQFEDLREDLRRHLGHTAVAISHIGSTSVEHLPAKPIIDIQVSVNHLDDLDPLTALPDQYQYVAEYDRDFPPLGYSAAQAEWNKQFFRVIREGKRYAQVHVREQGRLNHRIALLFRDFIAQSELHRQAYARLKMRLAEAVGHLASDTTSGPYVDLKDPMIAVILHHAEQWAHQTNWKEPIE